MRKALLPPDSMRQPGRPRVLDSRWRRGTSRRSRGLSARSLGTYLCSSRIGPRHAHRHRLDHPRCNRRWPRDAASHAALAKSGDPRCSNSWQACTARSRYRWVRRGSLPAFARKSRGLSHVARPRRAREKRRPTQRHGRKRPPACAGEDRTLEVMLARRSSLQKSTDSVLAKTGERPPFHPIWKRSPTVA
jgi:hypothetical protein